MPHFFINSQNVNNDIAIIDDKENYKHIAKALRIRKGEKLLLIDENKIQYETIVKDVTPTEIISIIQKSYTSTRTLPFDLYFLLYLITETKVSCITSSASASLPSN